MDLKNVLLSIVIFIGTTSRANHVYTSMEQLKGLSRLETFLTTMLESYVNDHKRTPKVIRHFSEEMVNITRHKNSIGLEDFINHPSNVFLLVRRFLKHWTELSEYLDQGTKSELQKILHEHKEEFKIFPESSDLVGCATALLRIQEVYRLSVQDMADGNLAEGTKGPRLGADECFELGYVTHRQNDFSLARDWLKETLLRMSPEYGYRGSLNRLRVLEYLGWAEYQLGNVDEAIELTNQILEKDPENTKAKEALKSYKMQQRYRSTYNNNIAERLIANHRENRKDKDLVAYERLCREEIFNSHPKELLSCFYKYDHPTLRLKPAKIEVVSIEPEIQILHDAISDSEIDSLVKQAKPTLKRAFVANMTTGEPEYTDTRISKSTWIQEKRSSTAISLSNRLHTLTGLLTSDAHSEFLQIVNYGVAGHYEAHYDYLSVFTTPSLDDGRGDRIATVLLYLSDVTAGGATVFLEPEIIVKPKKGNAIFWYNLLQNGRPDLRTSHGACPVIVGSKWVANKWILERGQDTARPCSLDEFK